MNSATGEWMDGWMGGWMDEEQSAPAGRSLGVT